MFFNLKSFSFCSTSTFRRKPLNNSCRFASFSSVSVSVLLRFHDKNKTKVFFCCYFFEFLFQVLKHVQNNQDNEMRARVWLKETYLLLWKSSTFLSFYHNFHSSCFFSFAVIVHCFFLLVCLFHCKMVRSECKRNNRLLESACNNTKLPIDRVNIYAWNCVRRPLTISSSSLNIYWILDNVFVCFLFNRSHCLAFQRI